MKAWTVCGQKGKIPFSRSEALRSMQRLKDIGADDPNALLNIYRCADCRRWHVGHSRYRKRTEAA